jgi:hypothetical protein
MKCWISAFNAQGSRLIIVALHVRAVKIYAATIEALKKKEKKGSPQKLRYPHPWMLMGFFFGESHPIYDQTEGFSVVFLIL